MAIKPSERKRITLSLPDYEMRLLTALCFFLGRPLATQAAAALALYLRSSGDRIMKQVEYYAYRVNLKPMELLDLIFENPEQAQRLLEGEEKIHEGESDIFTDD